MYEANRNIKPKTSLIYCRVKKPEPGRPIYNQNFGATKKSLEKKDDYRQI